MIYLGFGLLECTTILKNLNIKMLKGDDQDIYFFNYKFPRIQRLANKMGADIGFEDEAGVDLMIQTRQDMGLKRTNTHRQSEYAKRGI